MTQLTELDRVRAILRRVMEREGIKAKPLSIKAGLGETAVRDIFERDGTDVRIGTLRKLAAALDTTIDEFIGSEPVPLVGKIGAGGHVIYTDDSADGTVPRPPGIGGELEAMVVEGDSMLPRYSSGDVVYIQRSHDGVLPMYVGEYCAVRLRTGETYVKLLARGSRPGFYDLRSLNAADVSDVEIEWATPIMFVLPRLARHMMGL